MKNFLIIVVFIICSFSAYGQTKNWLEYKESFYIKVLSDFIDKRDDYLKRIIQGKVIYGEYNDVSLNDNIEFEDFFIRVLSHRELHQELCFQKKDYFYMLKLWPLKVEQEGRLECSVSLYKVSIHYALETLELEHIETEQYVFDLKGCELELKK